MQDTLIKILLLEDDEEDYFLFDKLLKKAAIPYKISWSSTYANGLDNLKKNKYDICFIDYHLGKHTGLDLLVQLNKMQNWQPVIMLTGHGDEESGAITIQKGAQDYLMKGEITPDLLRRSIRYSLERTRLRKREEQLLKEQVKQRTIELQTLMNTVPIGIGISQDKNCDKIIPNSEFTRMLRLPQAQNVSITTSNRKPPFKIFIKGNEVSGSELPMHTAARTGKAVRDVEFEIRHIDGTKNIILGYSYPLFDENNSVRGAIGAFLDITGRKVIEDRKDEFIGVASHELKTPLTSMKTFVQILEKRLLIKGDKKDAYILGNITKQVNRLSSLINDLLNVNRITQGRLDLNRKWFDFDSLIKKVVIDYQYTTDTHEIAVRGSLDRKIYADENRIEQVLTNLISNAIKYSPHGDKIIINIQNNGKHVITQVQDFGLGITKEDQSKIFHRFYRTLEKRDYNIPGFGLGLYISMEIVKRHKGKMWVESKKGKGSTFSFSLPLKNESL